MNLVTFQNIPNDCLLLNQFYIFQHIWENQHYFVIAKLAYLQHFEEDNTYRHVLSNMSLLFDNSPLVRNNLYKSELLSTNSVTQVYKLHIHDLPLELNEYIFSYL